MKHVTRWCAIITLGILTSCAEQPLQPEGSGVNTQLAAAVAPPIQLANGGTSSMIFAKAISPAGWILGNFHLDPLTTRAQSWSPYPDLTVGTISNPGSIYSGTDGHGDVTAHVRDAGPVVFLADPGTMGRVYAVVPLPDLPTDAATSMSAHAINDDHVVVGWAVGSHALVWTPTGPAARSWNPPAYLPLPFYPGGYDAFMVQANGINNAGHIVGIVREIKSTGRVYHATLWWVQYQDGRWETTLVGELPKDPRASEYRAEQINDAGVIAGVAYLSKGEAPALWFPDAPGVYTRPPTILSGIQDWAIGGLNSCGWLAFTSMGKSAAYLWNGTTTVLLPRLSGATGGRAYDVNDRGDVVGMAQITSKGNSSGVAVLWLGAVPACP